MLWACILFPQLALDGVLRNGQGADKPLVLLAGSAQRPVLQAVNPAARKLGLKPGLTLAAAQALTRDFLQRDYDPAAIAHWQQFLAGWAYGFSSQVSLHYPRALLLEVGSSLRLFGPWPQLEARWRAELCDLGFQHRITLAPNPVAARVLANARDGLALEEHSALPAALGPLPIERLGWPRETASALARMGLRRLHQVLELPRAGLARRFGADFLLYLDRLLGLRALPLAFYRPPDHFEARLELNFEVQSQQALLFPLRRLIQDLAVYLRGRDQGVQRFNLHLQHRNLPDSLLPVGLLHAERDPALLFELTRSRLEHLQLPAPVQAVRLTAKDLPSFQPQHRQLFDKQVQGGMSWAQLCERLRARLGDDAVQQIAVHADHRPEHAWQAHASNQQADRKNEPLSAYSPRPAWLLPQPQIVEDALILSGPERIESGWWDGGDVRRDYFQVRMPLGGRGWAFRPLGQAGPLLLQGWFA